MPTSTGVTAAVPATMPVPRPLRTGPGRFNRFHENPHLIRPQAKLAASHVDDARVAGTKDSNLPASAQADLLQTMGGIAGGLQRDNDAVSTGP